MAKLIKSNKDSKISNKKAHKSNKTDGKISKRSTHDKNKKAKNHVSKSVKSEKKSSKNGRSEEFDDPMDTDHEDFDDELDELDMCSEDEDDVDKMDDDREEDSLAPFVPDQALMALSMARKASKKTSKSGKQQEKQGEDGSDLDDLECGKRDFVSCDGTVMEEEETSITQSKDTKAEGKSKKQKSKDLITEDSGNNNSNGRLAIEIARLRESLSSGKSIKAIVKLFHSIFRNKDKSGAAAGSQPMSRKQRKLLARNPKLLAASIEAEVMAHVDDLSSDMPATVRALSEQEKKDLFTLGLLDMRRQLDFILGSTNSNSNNQQNQSPSNSGSSTILSSSIMSHDKWPVLAKTMKQMSSCIVAATEQEARLCFAQKTTTDGSSFQDSAISLLLAASADWIAIIGCFPRILINLCRAILVIWSGHADLDIKAKAVLLLRQICLWQQQQQQQQQEQQNSASSTKNKSSGKNTSSSEATALASSGQNVIEYIMHGIYKRLIKVARATSIHNMPVINFLLNSAVEVFRLDQEKAYLRAVAGIRQLAEVQRFYIMGREVESKGSKEKPTASADAKSSGTATPAHKKAKKSSGNGDSQDQPKVHFFSWTTVVAFRFWTRLLSVTATSNANDSANPNYSLSLLTYPLMQLLLGSLSMESFRPQFYPFYLHCMSCANDLAQATGTLLTGLSASMCSMLEGLMSTSMKPIPKADAATSMPPLDILACFKAPSKYTDKRIYLEVIAEELLFQLVRHACLVASLTAQSSSNALSLDSQSDSRSSSDSHSNNGNSPSKAHQAFLIPVLTRVKRLLKQHGRTSVRLSHQISQVVKRLSSDDAKQLSIYASNYQAIRQQTIGLPQVIHTDGSAHASQVSKSQLKSQPKNQSNSQLKSQSNSQLKSHPKSQLKNQLKSQSKSK